MVFPVVSQQANLKGVNVLWSRMGTVRQLFQGRLKPEILADIVTEYESGDDATLIIKRIPFRLQSGRRGGFKYILQNRE
jgi:hypothetical protein